MSKVANNLLIAASGTGGHIFPALTIANEIDYLWDITWLGIKNRCEEQLVPKRFKLFTLKFSTPKKKNICLIFQYLRILFATFEIIKIIKKKNITLVFTTGGYISAPTILAAKILKIPVIIHESNIIPGTVTKFFGRFCNFVLIGFKETEKYLNHLNIIYTGTPIREQFYSKQKLPPWVPKGDTPLILVMGGSQGAQAINDMLKNCLDFLLFKNLRVVHILGDSKSLDLEYYSLKNYIQIKFTNEIPALMQNCDLVISRSGAGAINELMCTKKPSILVPYPNAKSNHQEKNALLLASIGGSILINQSSKSKIFLKNILSRMFDSKDFSGSKSEILASMNQNMLKIKFKDSREEIKKIINQFKKED